MSDQHASKYYFGPGTETNAGSGTISTYTEIETAPAALSDTPADFSTPQPGLNAPVAQDKRRGSS